MAMTHAKFASQAAYLASRCASWAGEVAAYPDYSESTHMRDDSVERFVNMLRETADFLEDLQKEDDSDGSSN